MSLTTILWAAIKAHVAADERPPATALRSALGYLERALAHEPALQQYIEEMVGAKQNEVRERLFVLDRATEERERETEKARVLVAQWEQTIASWEAQDERLRFAAKQLAVLDEEMRSGSPYKTGTRAMCMRSIGLITAAALGWTGDKPEPQDPSRVEAERAAMLKRIREGE